MAEISKARHAQIFGIPYDIYKIIYERGWRDAEERIKKEKATKIETFHSRVSFDNIKVKPVQKREK